MDEEATELVNVVFAVYGDAFGGKFEGLATGESGTCDFSVGGDNAVPGREEAFGLGELGEDEGDVAGGHHEMFTDRGGGGDPGLRDFIHDF